MYRRLSVISELGMLVEDLINMISCPITRIDA